MQIGAIVAVTLDIIFKRLALAHLSPDAPVFGNRFVDILLFKNQGIAFSIQLPILLSIGVSVLLIGYFSLPLVKSSSTQLKTASLFIVLGSCSNLFDRITHGFVVDYILLFGRSAINIADILILFGILLYIRYNKPVIQHSPIH